MGKRKERWDGEPTILKAIKFKLKPTPETAEVFELHTKASGMAYNVTWWRWFVQYHLTDTRSSTFDAIKDWRALRKIHYPWIGLVCNSYAESYAIEALQSAFQHFFRRVKSGQKQGKGFGFPKRKKPWATTSFRIHGGTVRIDGRTLVMPGKFAYSLIGDDTGKKHPLRTPVPIGFERGGLISRFPPEYVIHTCTIRKTAGEWYCALQIEYPAKYDQTERPTGDIRIVHRGVVRVATTDQEVIHRPRSLDERFAYLMERTGKIQKQLTRMQKDSKRAQKKRLYLQKTHAKIANIREAMLHNATARITGRHDEPVGRPSAIVTDGFSVAGLISQHQKLRIKKVRVNFNKKILGAGMGEFKRQLQYKCGWLGIQLEEAPAQEAISKRCSTCELVRDEKEFNAVEWRTRHWVCDFCGTEHELDENAINNLSDWYEHAQEAVA